MTHYDEDAEWLRQRRTIRGDLFMVAILLTFCIGMLFMVRAAHGAQVSEEVRLAKGRVIVDALYPDSGFRPWIGTLISAHEGYGDEGFAAAWWYSLTYGAANFKLKVGGVAPGGCAGPMDVKHWPLVLEPGANIRHHVAEMWTGWEAGHRGRRLCEYVMLPSAPRDCGRGMFRRTDAAHRDLIAEAWRLGTLTQEQSR